MVDARKGSFGEMHGDGWYEVARDRAKCLREAAEEARLAREATRENGAFQTRVRARVARRLFALAVAVERRETWRVVWEKFGERGRL